MANPARGSSTWKAIQELGFGFLGVLVLCGLIYFLYGLLLRLDELKSYSHGIGLFRLWTVVVLMGLGAFGSIVQFRDQFRAINTSEKVAAAIGDIKDKTPGKSISEITSEDVAANLKGAKVGKKALDQLVEQHKQQLLIDDEYFREELGLLIVDYLQPLPRNVKRLLNRFRVNLLIAHGRGLFTTEPKVSTQQLGKWLVLMERWPQLGRALSAAPDRMRGLEEASGIAVVAQRAAAAAAPSPAAAASPLQSASADPFPAVAPPLDSFMELIRILAPFYVGDEDLRKFVHSEPPIAPVVARLAHFGTDELPEAEMGAAAS
jgi:hypothetical protein